MGKTCKKIKAGLDAFWIALLSFPFKVKGLKGREWEDPQPDYWIYYPSQEVYWVPPHIEHEPATTIVDTIIKIVPRLLIAITFIIGIVSFIRIKKIDDKDIKKKKIKKTIIIITILIILFVGILLLPLFLNKYW